MAAERCDFFLEDGSFDSVIAVLPALNQKQETVTQKISKNGKGLLNVASVNTVSYTHLDVYKRQASTIAEKAAKMAIFSCHLLVSTIALVKCGNKALMATGLTALTMEIKVSEATV